MSEYASDTAAILGIAQDALSISADSTKDIGALDPDVYLDRARITGGDVRVFVGWLKWYVTDAYTSGRNTYADQYAVSVFVRRGDIGEAITEAKTLRDALNGTAYRRTGAGVRTLHVTDAYPVPQEDGDIDIIQFLLDII